ncbi:nucleotide exchange factor GrpE [Treponema primitia]|uniref:nucleotide exchange factor GrpE n=1 Tax=Treponema primitia TaxID=88058 RepID=UPI00397F65C6
MLDFEIELNKLLSGEVEQLPRYEIAQAVEMAALGQDLADDLRKKQTDVSLQVEEIYDLLKEQNTLAGENRHVMTVLQEALETEKKRADTLALGTIALCDLLENFCTYAQQSGSEELKNQADILWTQSGRLLADNNIVRLGAEGQPLDPRIHTVQKGVESPFPREQVLELLQSGYTYKNALVRKASVVVSLGTGEVKDGE